ncbi:methyltransferase domain-containing protein [Bosea sp. (in: a-proteobacteria)]|uniref:methyltransferase domain-containing protein n=1 Tax=Bosea sp. (in: a-proteobacteria) TaxID=1871050 RepID=UPI003B3BD29F
MKPLACRFCGSHLTETFADLGMSPLANSYVRPEAARDMEPFYPLHAYVCSDCRLVQIEQVATPDHIFSDYLYFSSYSDSWLRHAEAYCDAMIKRFSLGPQSQVVEIASNDGYLLQYFKARGVPVLGVEPAANVAKFAIEKGIDTRVAFFGAQTAIGLSDEGFGADLVAANNVMAHVPDLNDFVRGFKNLLKPTGVVTVEFPHLLTQMRENQFDTIYHEHFSYFSLLAAEKVFAHHGLVIFDVDQLSTHGGSLRIYGRHRENDALPVTEAVGRVRAEESAAGLDGPDAYKAFAKQVVDIKCEVLSFLIEAKRAGKTVVGYGAPAKGNTLLNYCGVKTDFIAFTVDRSPHKQGTLLPGTHIPVRAPEAIAESKPDYVLILPWNLKDEVMEQMSGIRDWGGKFVVAIPRLQVIE